MRAQSPVRSDNRGVFLVLPRYPKLSQLPLSNVRIPLRPRFRAPPGDAARSLPALTRRCPWRLASARRWRVRRGNLKTARSPVPTVRFVRKLRRS